MARGLGAEQRALYNDPAMKHFGFWLLVFLLAACGDDGGAVDAGDPADAYNPGDGGAAFDDAPAQILLVERSDNMGGAYSGSVVGTFATSTVFVYDELLREGSCRQLEGSPSFCEQPCDGYCVGNGECVPYPERMSVGTLTMTGLSEPVSIDPEVGNYYSYYGARQLTRPGTAIRASAPGAEFGGFDLSVLPPEPLVVSNFQDLALVAGTPLTIEWTPGSNAEARVRLWLLADLNHGQIHGAVIHCDVPDTGSLTIPAAWVDWIRDPRYWGCGDCIESHISRYTRAATTIDGTALELVVHSRVGLYLVP